MPVAVLMMQFLGINTNGSTTFYTGVGTQLVEALGAHVLLILLHVLLALQVVTAIVAVKAFSHGRGEIAPRALQKTVVKPGRRTRVSVCMSECVRAHGRAVEKQEVWSVSTS